jgi:hypothetical protein
MDKITLIIAYITRIAKILIVIELWSWDFKS